MASIDKRIRAMSQDELIHLSIGLVGIIIYRNDYYECVKEVKANLHLASEDAQPSIALAVELFENLIRDQIAEDVERN